VLRRIPVADFAARCGVDERLDARGGRTRIASAKSVSMMEDLGVQMNLHSTLNSYLDRLVWLLTGTSPSRVPTTPSCPSACRPSSADRARSPGRPRRARPQAAAGYASSPVTGAKVIMGLIPCNAIPEEILTDHPKRFRAMFIESANPLHSLADSQRMRQALRALDLVSVVIDVAMTETARQADYVLPASSQFEKAEATFFNVEFPRNGFHLRQPLFPPRPGTLTEAEITRAWSSRWASSAKANTACCAAPRAGATRPSAWRSPGSQRETRRSRATRRSFSTERWARPCPRASRRPRRYGV
jgi:anaerobic selenocysteine-containing dehydrogenase